MARSKRGAKAKSRSKPRKPTKAQQRAAERAAREARILEEEAAARSREWHFVRTLEGRLTRALELAQDLARAEGAPTLLHVRRPPASSHSYSQGAGGDVHGRRNRHGEFVWRAPWAIVGRFSFRGEIGYVDLHRVLARWLRRRDLRDRVDETRLARLRVTYVDAQGQPQEYTLSETLPWGFALSRAIQAIDPDDESSLAARYDTSRLVHLTVWLSTEKGTPIDVKLARWSSR